MRRRRALETALVTLVVAAGAVLFLFPVLWMLSTSLKTNTQVYAWPPELLPSPLRWQNYVRAWTALPTPLFFRNSLWVTLLATVGTAFSASLVAFGFARLRFRGSDWLFFLMLSTLLLPPQVTLIPLYIFFSQLKWIDTYLPLVVPALFLANFPLPGAFFVFLLRQFYLTIPHDLDDAARIDGCGYLGIFTRIVLPLTKPALLAVVIFAVTWTWNDFMGPLIYLNSLEKYTVVIGLHLFQGRFGQVELQPMMALATLAVLPILALFLVAQRQFVEGITLTGLKG